MRNAPPRERLMRLKFERIVQNSLEVLKLCCMSVCGPGILLESLLTLLYYKQILHGCPKIPDNLTNVMIYILLISGCMSLSITAYCCYSTIQLGKLLKEMWPEIRFARPQRNAAARGEDEEAVSIMSENTDGNRNSRASSVYSERYMQHNL